MRTRIISGIVMVPVVVILFLLGGNFLKGALLIASLIGMNEFYKAFSKENKPIHFVGYIFAVIYYLFMERINGNGTLFSMFVAAFLLVILSLQVKFHKTVCVTTLITVFFGMFYVALMLSYLYLIRSFEYGKFIVWLPIIAAWGCDTGAYFTGCAFGKRKLIPDLSPKKTVEGAVGGVLIATILAFLFAVITEKYVSFDGYNFRILCVLAGFFGSIFSQFGDLSASAIKRYTGIKDYGKLIPGHGGILDRFDSVLFTAPAVYIVFNLLMYIK